MRVNSAESLAWADRIIDRFGSWEKVREASRFVDGVYVIERTPEDVGVVPLEARGPRKPK